MCIFHPLTFLVISSGNFIIPFFVGEESKIQKIKKFINIISTNNSTQDWVLNLGMSNSKDESLNHYILIVLGNIPANREATWGKYFLWLVIW